MTFFAKWLKLNSIDVGSIIMVKLDRLFGIIHTNYWDEMVLLVWKQA